MHAAVRQAGLMKFYSVTDSSDVVVRVVDVLLDGMTRLLVAGRFEIVPVV